MRSQINTEDANRQLPPGVIEEVWSGSGIVPVVPVSAQKARKLTWGGLFLPFGCIERAGHAGNCFASDPGDKHRDGREYSGQKQEQIGESDCACDGQRRHQGQSNQDGRSDPQKVDADRAAAKRFQSLLDGQRFLARLTKGQPTTHQGEREQ